MLFTAHDTGQPVGSAAGCGPFATCSSSPELLMRWRAPGEDLERREFSPGIPEVISKTLKDRSLIDVYVPLDRNDAIFGASTRRDTGWIGFLTPVKRHLPIYRK